MYDPKKLNSIAKYEKAISQKYGKETVTNPKSNWDDKKEKEYLDHLKKFYKESKESEDDSEKIEFEGFLISKTLISKESNRICPICKTYSHKVRDDLYMNKFDCCYNCYIQWVEGREERWKSGWRPEHEEEK